MMMKEEVLLLLLLKEEETTDEVKIAKQVARWRVMKKVKENAKLMLPSLQLLVLLLLSFITSPFAPFEPIGCTLHPMTGSLLISLEIPRLCAPSPCTLHTLSPTLLTLQENTRTICIGHGQLNIHDPAVNDINFVTLNGRSSLFLLKLLHLGVSLAATSISCLRLFCQ